MADNLPAGEKRFKKRHRRQDFSRVGNRKEVCITDIKIWRRRTRFELERAAKQALKRSFPEILLSANHRT
jgi:hypothetical protein